MIQLCVNGNMRPTGCRLAFTASVKRFQSKQGASRRWFAIYARQNAALAALKACQLSLTLAVDLYAQHRPRRLQDARA